MTTVTCLIDDAMSGHRALGNEHGLSLLITAPDITILFDCGSTDLLLRNASRLGLNPADAEVVVLSHGHYDHTGGFRAAINAGKTKRVLTGPEFFAPKYTRTGLRHGYMGPDFGSDFFEAMDLRHEVCGDVVPLGGSCWAIANIERTHPEETIPARYHIRNGDSFHSDPFEDEVSLAVRMEDGVALFVGCSHPGLLNIVDTTEKRLGLPVKGIWGGTHLMEATPERIQATLARLREKNIRHLGLSHCSGETAQALVDAEPAFDASPLRPGDGLVL